MHHTFDHYGQNSETWLQNQLVEEIEHCIKVILLEDGNDVIQPLNYISYVMDYDNNNFYTEFHEKGLLNYLQDLCEQRGKGYALYATCLTQDEFNMLDGETYIDSLSVYWLGDIHRDGHFIGGPVILYWLWQYLETGIFPSDQEFIDCSIDIDDNLIAQIVPRRFSKLLLNTGWKMSHIILKDENGMRQSIENKKRAKALGKKKGVKILSEVWSKKTGAELSYYVEIPKEVGGLINYKLKIAEALECYARVEEISQLTVLKKLGVRITK